MKEPADLPVSIAHPIWAKLFRYTVGSAGTALSFERRLARENGWTPGRAARVMDEYRRFCFLAATAGHEVTPSDAVDQAWHLHLTYSRDYWERFCPEVLGTSLHHGPTEGGAGERHRFFEQYARTLQSYERVFGMPPPADIWPDARQRLLDDPRARRVHPREAVIVPVWALRWLALAMLGAPVVLMLL